MSDFIRVNFEGGDTLVTTKIGVTLRSYYSSDLIERFYFKSSEDNRDNRDNRDITKEEYDRLCMILGVGDE